MAKGVYPERSLRTHFGQDQFLLLANPFLIGQVWYSRIMADDSTQQPVSSQTPSAVDTSDLANSAADQQPAWPDTPKMAKEEQESETTVTTSPQAQPQTTEVAKESQTVIQQAPSAVTTEPSPEASPSAIPEEKIASEVEQPEPTISTDLSAEASAKEELPKEATPSATPEPTKPPEAETTPIAVPVSSSPVTPPITPIFPPTPEPAAPPSSETSSSSDLSDVSTLSDLPSSPQADTNVQSLSDQTPQVQPEAPASASSNTSVQTPSQVAEIKPEPPQAPQETSLAKEEDSKPSQKSFGDLLQGNEKPESPPLTSSNPPINSSISQTSTSPLPTEASAKEGQSPAPSPQKPVSFGDLIKDIEITPPSIPETQRPVEQKQPTSLPPYAVPTTSPLSQSQVITEEEVQRQIHESLTAEQKSRRSLANKSRRDRKEKNLVKIIDYLKQNQVATNNEVRDLLQVSQSSATNYLAELTKRGMVKREGIRASAKYHL